MSLKVNETGLAQALTLMKQAQFRLNTIWDANRPSPEVEDNYINQHGMDAYAAWHLAIDTAAPDGSKARYQLPYGDFKSVHHTGVRRISQHAQRDGQTELVDAAEEILDLFDRYNAC
jgi:hypothetical protein